MKRSNGLLVGSVLLLMPAVAAAQGAGAMEHGTLDLASVKKLEQHLSDAGFSPGPVDGKVDERTKLAVREYQQAKGLEVTGLLDAETQAALLAQSDGVTKGESGPGARPGAGEFRDSARPPGAIGGPATPPGQR